MAEESDCVESYRKIEPDLKPAVSLSPQHKAWEKYSDLISKKVGDCADGLLKDLKSATDEFTRFNPWFPNQRFETFLEKRKELFEGDEYTKLKQQNLTIGDVLQREFKEYYPDVIRLKDQQSLKESVHTLIGQIRHPRDALKNWDQIFKNTCLSKLPAARKNIVADLLLNLAADALIQSNKEDPTWGNFPWEFIAQGVVWSIVYNSIGCKNIFRQGPLIGSQVTEQALTQTTGVKNFIVKSFANSKNYLKWMVPLEFVTVGSLMAADHLRGEKKDSKDYLERAGLLLLYDTGVGIPKRVFVLDPLFLKAFPWMSATVDRLVKNRVLANAVTQPTQTGVRIAIRYGENTAFLGYNDWLNAHGH